MFTVKVWNYIKIQDWKLKSWKLTNQEGEDLNLTNQNWNCLIGEILINWLVNININLQCVLWYKLNAFFCWHRYRLFLYLFYFYYSYYCNTHTLARTRNISQGTSDNLRGKIFRNRYKLKMYFYFNNIFFDKFEINFFIFTILN